MNTETPFEQFLKRQDEEAWAEALATLRRSIHEVDRSATEIWFYFYPLALVHALEAADNREQLARQLLLQGDYELKNQIDSSHRFLYGHRFWPQVKQAVEEHANAWERGGVGSGGLGVGTEQRVGGGGLGVDVSNHQDESLGLDVSNQHPTPNSLHPSWALGVDVSDHQGESLGVDASNQNPAPNTLHPSHATSLADQIIAVAKSVAGELKKEEPLLVGITAVAFMTVQQVGFRAFKAAPGKVNVDRRHAKKLPAQILRERARDDSQGLFGFLKTINKQWTVTWDENDDRAKYRLREGQDLAWGAADEQSRDWRAIDSRRIEGPIPVECRSASCGTCWVGVLGGAEKLSDVGAREGKKIKEFGYIDTAEPKPLIRLACQAQPQGAVSIVIPPWNGQFGKYLKSLRGKQEQSNHPQPLTSESTSSVNETVN